MFISKHRSLAKSVVLIGLLVVSPVFAQAQTKEHGEKKEALKIPATLKEIWQKVKEQQQELHTTVAIKKLSEVHHVAFAIRDYVAAMPKKSTNLSKEKLADLTKSVKRVASLATFLDEAGDTGDSAKTANLVVRLDNELVKIEMLYPSQTFGPAKK